MSCVGDTDCAVGFYCVDGTCVQQEGDGTECSAAGNPCTTDCVSEVLNAVSKVSSCGVGPIPPVVCPSQPDCNKFCDDYQAATGETLAGCTPDSACSTCDFCGSEGICESKKVPNRPCYCPAYLDNDRVVDDTANRDCYLCDTDDGGWVLDEKICEKSLTINYICDCPGEVVQAVGKSSKKGANLFALAIKDGERKCKDACLAPCPYGSEWTCDVAGPIPPGEDPLFNYPCPKGWTCTRSGSATSVNGESIPNPGGGYFYYTCAFPGWPNITWEEYLETEACGCPEQGTCTNITHDASQGAYSCDPASKCTKTGEMTAGGATLEFWEICPVDGNDDIPGCTSGKRYHPIYLSEYPEYAYAPCTCEIPQGTPVRVPAYSEFSVAIEAGEWPFELREDAGCTGNGITASETRCATRTKLKCFPNPIGFNPPIICVPENEYLLLRQLCANEVAWDHSRLFTVLDGSDIPQAVMFLASVSPDATYLNTLAYGRTEAFIWRDARLPAGSEFVYDLPPFPEEYVKYRKCSEEPTLVGLIDIWAESCAGDEKACNWAIAERPDLFGAVEYNGSVKPTPEGIRENEQREDPDAPPIPVATNATFDADFTPPPPPPPGEEAEEGLGAGSTLGSVTVQDGGGEIFAVRWEDGADQTPDGFFSISNNGNSVSVKIVTAIGLSNGLTYTYNYQVGSTKGTKPAWSDFASISIRVFNIPPPEPPPEP